MLAEGQRDWSPLDTLLGTRRWEPGWWLLRGRGKNEATTHAPIRKPHKMRFTKSQTLLITYPFYRPRVSPKSQARWGVRDTDTSKTQDLVSKCSQVSTR